MTRRSVGISSATPLSQFEIIKVEEKRDQGACTLSQHRGLQVRHGVLSHAAHADGAAEARAGLQAHGGRRRDRGGAPGTPATYVAMGHLYFDSTDAFQAAFAPHAQSILADIPNYTNTQPTIQVSEVRL
jgi:uncharacterized protein (TIGR02118 family)